MAEDQLEARLRRRMQTATLSINSAFRLTLWTVLNEVPDIADISGHFEHVVFVRLSTQESYLLDEEIFKWGFNEWHTERQHAEEIASRPPDDEESEFLNTVAAYLFYYWSWANSVMRNVLALHKASKEGGLDGAKLLSLLASNLATRSDDTFVADSRRSRVNELLNDEANAKFFATLRANPEDTLADVKQIAIAPHPADLRTWRLLAYQVQKMQHHLVLRSWPGVHWAAWKAAYLKGEDVDCEAYYPFYDVWHPLVAPEDSEWDEDESRPSSGMPSSDSAEEELADTAASDSASEKSAPDPGSMFEDVENLLAASDVWDVWRLCKVVLCGTAYQGVDQEPGTEYLFRKLERYLPFRELWTRMPVVENSKDELLAVFQRMQPFEKEIVLGHGYISAKYEQVRHYWPLPLPYQFIDFWDYSNFSFREVPEAVAKQLLRELDLDATEYADEIDLVCLLGCKRHPFRTTEDLQSFRHTIYLTDDIQQKWAGGMDFPGQYYPCNCEDERLWSRVPEDDRKKARYFQNGHFAWDHLGGNTVFRRSKLDHSNFCRELDRYWDDWNDCALIFGKGETEDLDIVDGDTIYILESLPGVKARQLKESTPDREAGLLLACAYFEEKWAARQSTRSSMEYKRTAQNDDT